MPLKLYSDIYPPEIKPVRDGAYGVKAGLLRPPMHRFWRNGKWYVLSKGDLLSATQNWHWYGLAFDPDAAEPCEGDVISVSSQRIVTVRGVFIPGAEVE